VPIQLKGRDISSIFVGREGVGSNHDLLSYPKKIGYDFKTTSPGYAPAPKPLSTPQTRSFMFKKSGSLIPKNF